MRLNPVIADIIIPNIPVIADIIIPNIPPKNIQINGLTAASFGYGTTPLGLASLSGFVMAHNLT